MVFVGLNSLNFQRLWEVNVKTKAYLNHEFFVGMAILNIPIDHFIMNIWYKVLVILISTTMCEQKASKQKVIKNHIWSHLKFNRLSECYYVHVNVGLQLTIWIGWQFLTFATITKKIWIILFGWRWTLSMVIKLFLTILNHAYAFIVLELNIYNFAFAHMVHTTMQIVKKKSLT